MYNLPKLTLLETKMVIYVRHKSYRKVLCHWIAYCSVNIVMFLQDFWRIRKIKNRKINRDWSLSTKKIIKVSWNHKIVAVWRRSGQGRLIRDGNFLLAIKSSFQLVLSHSDAMSAFMLERNARTLYVTQWGKKEKELEEKFVREVWTRIENPWKSLNYVLVPGCQYVCTV